MELISVIVPVYKVEEYLDKCIQSILDQTYYNIELILVNDGSPDRCGEICDKWAKIDSRISVLHKNNGGLSDARNFGIDIANGEYLTFIDSDDYIEKDYLEILYNLLIENSADIACCQPNAFLENKLKNNYKNKNEIQVLSSENAFIEMLYEGATTNSAWGKLYKKKLFNSIRYPKGKLYEDMFTTYKLIMQSNKIVCTSLKLYNYLIRNSSILGTINPYKQRDMISAAEEMLDFAIKNVPKAIEAANYKVFMASVNILVRCDIFNNDQLELINYMWANIKRDRISVILNRKVTKKYRLLALISLGGRRVMQLSYKMLAKR